MGEEKQIELDTDWMSALLAIFALAVLVAFTGIEIWHVVAGRPLATHVPTISIMNMVAVAFGLWLGLGPGSSRLPRAVRILIVVWAAQWAFHLLVILMHVSSQTWVLISPLESWFHAIIAAMTFVYLAAWLKGTIRHA